MQELILNHYPQVIKKMREIQEIAKGEDIEFQKLDVAIKRASQNMFVATADEAGLERLEGLLGITPNTSQGIEDRRLYILSMMNRRRMGMSELRQMLSAYSEDITLVIEEDSSALSVTVGDGARHIQAIHDILEEMIPLQVYIRYKLKVSQMYLDGTGRLDGSSLLGGETKEWEG